MRNDFAVIYLPTGGCSARTDGLPCTVPRCLHDQFGVPEMVHFLSFCYFLAWTDGVKFTRRSEA